MPPTGDRGVMRDRTLSPRGRKHQEGHLPPGPLLCAASETPGIRPSRRIKTLLFAGDRKCHPIEGMAPSVLEGPIIVHAQDHRPFALTRRHPLFTQLSSRSRSGDRRDEARRQRLRCSLRCYRPTYVLGVRHSHPRPEKEPRARAHLEPLRWGGGRHRTATT